MLKDAKNTSKFFKFVGSINQEECGPGPMSRSSVYQALTEEEYESVSQWDLKLMEDQLLFSFSFFKLVMLYSSAFP